METGTRPDGHVSHVSSTGLPLVAIVGRMNVGKSTLFNRLSERVKSMTMDYAGVTRDILKDQVSWKDQTFEIVDTGGISLRKSDDKILEQVRRKAFDTLKKADVIMLVVDGSAGLMAEDREIALAARELNKKIVLVINKWDRKDAEANQYDFYELNHDAVVGISAEHGTNILELLDAVISFLPKKGAQEIEEPSFKVVFLGRPNVGKSSLMNEIVQEERSLVSDVAGTTREALSEKINFYQEHLQLTDTPGIRRKSAVDEDIEQLMVKSSFQALKDTDLVVLLLDGSEPTGIVDQELKLAFYAFQEQSKALIIVINKSDLMDEMAEKTFETSFEPYQHLMTKVPLLKISCKTGKNVGKLLPLIKTVWDRHSQKFNDNELHLLFVDALRKTPLVRNRQDLIVYKTKQVHTAPITIQMRVNNPDFFESSQLAFFDNVMRKEYDLVGAPIKFMVYRH